MLLQAETAILSFFMQQTLPVAILGLVGWLLWKAHQATIKRYEEKTDRMQAKMDELEREFRDKLFACIADNKASMDKITEVTETMNQLLRTLPHFIREPLHKNNA